MSDPLRERLESLLGPSYQIERELGGGGMSRVFAATETALGRPVVVKVLPPDLAGEMSVERFRREIQLAARLQHPHIVPVLAAGTGSDAADGGSGAAAGEPLLYYTMPLVEGESLRARLRREGELPIASVVRIARDLADALAYAHERGIVHRDLKPENVLLTRGHALVADFGVAKALSASIRPGDSPQSTAGLTSIGIALGTPTYMSPEQAAGDPATDHRADLYALGCVLYELLAGTPPFHGRPTQSLLAAHATEAPEPVSRRRPTTPPALAALVHRLLEKRPADRPQGAEEVLRSLESMEAVTTPVEFTAAGAGVAASGPADAPTAGRTPTPISGYATAPAAASPLRLSKGRLGLVAGALAGVALVVALATFMGSDHSRGGSPGGESAPSPDSPIGVSIGDFAVRSGPAELAAAAGMIRDYIVDAVEGLDHVDVVADSGAALRFSIVGQLDPLGADSASVRLRLVDPRDGRVLRIFTPARIALANPVDGIDRLRSRVQGAVGVVSHPMLGPGALPRDDSPTAESFAEFASALEEIERAEAGLRPSGERLHRHLSRAMALDPSYLQPAIWQGYAATYLVSNGYAAGAAILDSLRTTAGGRMSPYEDAIVTTILAWIRGDIPAVLRSGSRAYELSPVRWLGMWKASALLDAGRYDEARILLDSLRPMAQGDLPQYWTMLGRVLHLRGEYLEELEAARQARSLMPDRIGIRTNEIRALIAVDSIAAAQEAIEAALTLPDERDAGDHRHIGVLSSAVAEYRAHGHAERARAMAPRILTILRSLDLPQVFPATRRNLYYALLGAGETAEAIAYAMRAAPMDSNSYNTAAILGSAGALSGDTAQVARAHRWIERITAQRGGFASGEDLAARARIAGAAGKQDEALRLLTAAVTNGAGFGPGRFTAHALPEFDGIRGRREFRRLVYAE